MPPSMECSQNHKDLGYFGSFHGSAIHTMCTPWKYMSNLESLGYPTNALNNDQSKGQVNASAVLNGGRTGDGRWCRGELRV